MATITRENLFRAIEEASPEFVSREARRELNRWAFDVTSFNVGTWDKCPLDQIGFVDKFERRSNYQEAENTRFKHEASELDARILNYIKTDLIGEVPTTGLTVSVI